MKKQQHIVFFVCYFMCFSCGLTQTYYLEPPILSTLAIGDSHEDATYNRYNFKINNLGNAANIYYSGSTVYYKIYNSKLRMERDRASITAANTKYSSNGKNYLDTFKYAQLHFKDNRGITTDFLRKSASGDLGTEIRLVNQIPYLAGVFFNSSITSQYMPLRSIDRDFNFFEPDGTFSDSFNYATDGDVVYTESESVDTWYVEAYAVSNGIDPQFLQLYSQVLHLGVVRIKKP